MSSAVVSVSVVNEFAGLRTVIFAETTAAPDGAVMLPRSVAVPAVCACRTAMNRERQANEAAPSRRIMDPSKCECACINQSQNVTDCQTGGLKREELSAFSGQPSASEDPFLRSRLGNAL